jgi:hypothetical protein
MEEIRLRKICTWNTEKIRYEMITLRWMVKRWVVWMRSWTGLRDCPVAGLGVSDFEPLGCNTVKLVGQLAALKIINIFACMFYELTFIRQHIQNVPGLRVNTAGSNSRGNSEWETSYTHGSDWQRLRNCSKRAGSSCCRNLAYHLSDVAVRCMVQWARHQWHNITRLRKSDVVSYFRLFLVDYHNPMNGNLWYCWLHRG